LVFMIEKSLIAIMFVYCLGFSFLGVQFIFADVVHLQLKNFNGQPIHSAILQWLSPNTLAFQETNQTSESRSTVVNNPIYAAASVMWELLQLISGVYVFNIAYQLGLPLIFVAMFVALYLILVGRSIAGWIRGI
jgi:short subunit fatty acids transporter